VIRPLLAIPLIAIKNIEYVHYDLKIKKNDKKAEELAKHQFELFLKEDFIDFFMSPDYEKTFDPDGKRTNPAIRSLYQFEDKRRVMLSPGKPDQLNIKEKYIMEEENRLEVPLAQNAMQTLNTQNGAWTNREETWIMEDKRLLFATKTDSATTEWVEAFDQLVTETTQNLCN
jgi:hypothetical protein